MRNSIFVLATAIALVSYGGVTSGAHADGMPAVHRAQRVQAYRAPECGPYAPNGARCGCPDRYSCAPLYGAYGPYGGVGYWGGFTYAGWGRPW